MGADKAGVVFGKSLLLGHAVPPFGMRELDALTCVAE
jgi:hypothetical protein